MTFFRILALSAALTFTVLLSKFDHVSAQVGGVQACTNFTCRYGECEQFPTSYVCHCPAQVKGQHCEYKMLPTDSVCLSNPCWNGGQCVDLGSDFICQCPSGATGKDCRQITTAACLTSNPCRNNAVCMVTPQGGSLGAFCVCVGPWTGKFCEVSLFNCASQAPCFNGGSCVNGQFCQCPQNFTGYQCETFVQLNTDHVVKILNKGFYVADVRVDYELQQNFVKFPIQQKTSLVINQDYAFYIPRQVVLEGELGIVFTADARAGYRIFSVRVPASKTCVHVWGTTLMPSWSYVDCSLFDK